MSEKIKTIQELLEKKAIKKLENEIRVAIQNIRNNFKVSGVPVVVEKDKQKDLYYLLQDIEEALLEGNKEQRIREEINSFVTSMDEAKNAIEELQGATGF